MKILTNQEFHVELIRLVTDGAKSIYSIKIAKEDDDSYDISIWDEIENERAEDLEEGFFHSYEEANKRLEEIVFENLDVMFLRMEDSL